MKKNFNNIIIGCLLFATINHTTSFAQNANTHLSNLTAPVQVNINLLPKSNNSKDLGSFDKSWKDLYLDGAIYVNGNRFIAYNIGTGLSNTTVGNYTLINNTTGSYNAAFGAYSLEYNTSGSGNAAFGEAALWKNTTGQFNAAFGQNALSYNTTSNANSAFGNGALYISTGNSNSAFGEVSLWNNAAGSNNSAFGQAAGHSNVNGNENTYIGKNAGFSNQHSNYNVMVGSQSGYSVTGAQNTFVGTSAGRDFTLGNYNVCLGINAGYGGGAAKTGNYNTYIGGYTNAASSVINATALGYLAYVGSSYTVRIGDPTITSIGGYTNWSNISDGRMKKNIKQNVPGLSFINKLQPVTYNLDLDAADRIIQRPAIKD
ncbi:MAG: tail fiber domain-containing protein, partial [Parafilimonas sp.]